MREIQFNSAILFLVFFLFSCNKATPAGFWKNYRQTFLKENISNQGPYGGSRSLHWKSEKAYSFSSIRIIDFAKDNGWEFTDSSTIDIAQTTKWLDGEKEIFPMTSIDLTNANTNIYIYHNFPRWFGGNIKLYKFKTGWLRFEPGTDNSTEENGFVLISEDYSEFAVYHFWGE